MSEQQDPEKQAKKLGERLGFLLASSTLPDEVKEAIIVMLPELEPEQIDALMHMLEQNIAGSAEVEAKEFIENLKRAEEAFNLEAKASEEKALAELAEIEQLLDQAEK